MPTPPKPLGYRLLWQRSVLINNLYSQLQIGLLCVTLKYHTESWESYFHIYLTT